MKTLIELRHTLGVGVCGGGLGNDHENSMDDGDIGL